MRKKGNSNDMDARDIIYDKVIPRFSPGGLNLGLNLSSKMKIKNGGIIDLNFLSSGARGNVFMRGLELPA